MVQNVILRSNSNDLLVATNNSSPFVNFLASYLEKRQEATLATVNAVMNNFDKLNHEGVICRDEILEWLWNRMHQGSRIVCEVA